MTKPFYRRITEAFPQDLKKALKSRNIKELTEGYSFVFLSISLFILALYAAVSFIDYSNGRAEWLKARDNFAYWQEVAEKQKNSPDAYYQAAIYATELRDNQAAVGYLDKALELDPGFEKASELEKQLTTNN
jgi:tetratricopeptide (TPR) repeat protein